MRPHPRVHGEPKDRGAGTALTPVLVLALFVTQLQADSLADSPRPSFAPQVRDLNGASAVSRRCPGPRCRLITGPGRKVKCPRRSVRLTPGRDIQARIDSRPPGTTFCLRPGVYRLKVPLLPKSHDKFIGEYGAILTGSRAVRKWTRKDGLWVAKGQTQEGEVVPGVPCDAGVECNRPEGLFINDRALLQVSDLSQVGKGKFFFDYQGDRIFMVNDPRGRKVEASVGIGAFRSTGHLAEGVVIRNLVIKMFANPSRTGAIWDTVSPGWIVANNEVALNHGVGISHHNSARILHNYIHHNGQVGLGGYQSTNVLVKRNEIAWNAIGGFSGWEAGGAKYSVTTGLALRRNYVHHNKHHGLWTNGDNTATLFEGNTIVSNQGHGIFHEEAYDAIIKDNYIARNGGHGIYISSSSNVEAYGNILASNRTTGVQLFIDGATGYDLANNFVHDNQFTMRDGTYNGLHTARVDDPAAYSTSKNNRFQGNLYRVSDVAGRYWFWNGSLKTWKEWQAAGQDTTGKVSGSA